MGPLPAIRATTLEYLLCNATQPKRLCPCEVKNIQGVMHATAIVDWTVERAIAAGNVSKRLRMAVAGYGRVGTQHTKNSASLCAGVQRNAKSSVCVRTYK